MIHVQLSSVLIMCAGVHVADLTTRMSLHGGRLLVDQADMAVNAAMTGPLRALLGDETAEVWSVHVYYTWRLLYMHA